MSILAGMYALIAVPAQAGESATAWVDLERAVMQSFVAVAVQWPATR